MTEHSRRRLDDPETRLIRKRATVLFLAAGVIAVGTSANWSLAPRADAVPVSIGAGTGPVPAETDRLRAQIATIKGELRLASAYLDRSNRVFEYSKKYRIPADLAASIYDAAREERIDPALAFPLVRLESRFEERAKSSAGAIGLAQVMLPTARQFDPKITEEQLYDRETNLRIGFRYLRQLITWQRGNLELALIAYNRGPGAVIAAKELDVDPSNGYDQKVLRGYRGKGIID